MIWIVILGVSVLSTFALILWWSFRRKNSPEDWLFDTGERKDRAPTAPPKWRQRP